MVKAKVFIFAKHFDGMPKVDDFDLVEEELPELKDQGSLFSPKPLFLFPDSLSSRLRRVSS